MKDHASDRWVQMMSKIILGDRDGFQTRFDSAKSTFENISMFSRTPSDLQPISEAWRALNSNRNWEIFCNKDRFQVAPKSGLARDTARQTPNPWPVLPRVYKKVKDCYDTTFTAGSGVAASKMMTRDSVLKDHKVFHQALINGDDLSKVNWKTVMDVASSTDVCTWFISHTANGGWLQIDKDLVEKVKSDEFRANVKDASPMDRLKTIGSTFLHEATHTNQGGQLEDVVIPDGLKQKIPSCYNWKCVVEMAKEPSINVERNSDSIAILGIALKLWNLNHYVDEEGVIHEIGV
nr:uncharacterized protein CTRU02_03064 [Colletotrichum truncatum]KAF6798022.1 hypothetical protein CTRU02_03064 [Colletotrichum truncatum]